MTDTPGWTSPGSTEPSGEDPRADAGAAPGPSAPQERIPPQPGAYGGAYGGYGAPGGHGAAPGGWGPPPGQYPGWGAPPSPKPGVIPLRPLAVGELLDGSVSTVRRHWRTVLGISLALGILEQVGEAVTKWLAYPSSNAMEMLALMVPALLSGLLAIIANGLLTVVVSKAVLGQPTNLREAWNAARPRLGRLLGLTLLSGLIVAGVLAVALLPVAAVAYLMAGAGPAWMLLLVPLFLAGMAVAVWLWIKLSLAAPAIVLERQGVTAAMRRSWRLVKGSWWRLFGINLVTGLLIVIISSVAMAPFALLAAAFGDHTGFGSSMGGGDAPTLAGLAITAIGGTLVSAVTIPVSAAMTVLLYIDQRIRREALDIELARAAGLPEYGGSGWAGQGPTIPGQPTPPGA
jgi:hypothetical protein